MHIKYNTKRYMLCLHIRMYKMHSNSNKYTSDSNCR